MVLFCNFAFYKSHNMMDCFSYFTFACFQCSFDDIVCALENDSGIANGKYKLASRPFAFDLYENEPLSGGAHLRKSYFFKTKANADICVMFSNYADGWYTLANVLSIKLKCDVYLFSITDPSVLYGAMNSFRYISKGKSIRTVYAMQDPRWIFYENGEKQWFEYDLNYKQRIIKKRLNKDILVSYCEQLGFNISDPIFWQSEESVLFERTAKDWQRSK